jgi:hypothetical protein
VILAREENLFFGGGLLGDDAVILRGAFHAFANLFASWISSHKGIIMQAAPGGGKPCSCGGERKPGAEIELNCLFLPFC